jgi:hypothetical protein
MSWSSKCYGFSSPTGLNFNVQFAVCVAEFYSQPGVSVCSSLCLCWFVLVGCETRFRTLRVYGESHRCLVPNLVQEFLPYQQMSMWAILPASVPPDEHHVPLYIRRQFFSYWLMTDYLKNDTSDNRYSVQAGSEAHPASWPMGTGDFPGGKATGAWSWPLTSI